MWGSGRIDDGNTDGNLVLYISYNEESMRVPSIVPNPSTIEASSKSSSSGESFGSKGLCAAETAAASIVMFDLFLRRLYGRR